MNKKKKDAIKSDERKNKNVSCPFISYYFISFRLFRCASNVLFAQRVCVYEREGEREFILYQTNSKIHIGHIVEMLCADMRT